MAKEVKNGKKNKFTIAEKSLQNVMVLLAANNNFFNDIKKIRIKYVLKEPNPTNLMPLLDEAELLRIKYKLSPPHTVAISWFIIFDKKPDVNINQLFRKFEPKIYKNNYNEDILYIPIYPETTIEDVRDIWFSIMQLAEEVYNKKIKGKRIKKIENLDKNFLIARLKKLGYKNKVIRQFFNHSLPENSRDTIEQAEIPKILYELKKGAKSIEK